MHGTGTDRPGNEYDDVGTARNAAKRQAVKKDGVHFIEPIAGELACKTVGTGKLEDVENIVAQAMRLVSEPGAVATGVLADDGLVTNQTNPPPRYRFGF
jgi:phosphopantothenoylcysteine synthetase/decarboxylase